MTFTKDYFQTSDLAMVAFLWNEGCKISRVISDNSKKIFVFQNSSTLSKLLDEYLGRDARVEPIEYFSSLREVKNLMYRTSN